jgi:SH3-like domain-containing protein
MLMKLNRAILFCLSALFLGAEAQAAEFCSVAEVAILYDAPSSKAKKLFIAPINLPLEKIVSLGNWTKVRDVSGKLFWIENRVLTPQKMVVVIRPVASIREAADESSKVVFRATQRVAMEWLETDAAGWVKVRHQDGATGYVKSTEVWGE